MVSNAQNEAAAGGHTQTHADSTTQPAMQVIGAVSQDGLGCRSWWEEAEEEEEENEVAAMAA